MLSLNHTAIHGQAKLSSTIASRQQTLSLLLTSSGIFFLTALIGVWVAYDRGAAIVRFTTIMIGLGGAYLIPLLFRNHREQGLAWLSFGSAFLILAFSALFWKNLGSDSGLLAAGLALLLPLELNATVWAWASQHRLLIAFTVVTLTVGLLTLLMTGDHSAILSLSVGCISLLIWWRPLGRTYRAWIGWSAAKVMVLAVIMVVLAGWLLFTLPQRGEWLLSTGLGEAVISRLQLWHTVMPLIQDYQFTGSGLGSTAMVYSTYIYLVHVPFHPHVHNLFLQIAIEQGLPGLIGFLGIMSAILVGLLQNYRRAPTSLRPFYLSAWVSNVVLLVYGLFDAELYASPGTALMFAPLGFALPLLIGRQYKGRRTSEFDARRTQQRHTKADNGQIAKHWQHSRRWLIGGTPLLLVAALWFAPGAPAAQQANWGAVAQTHAELSLYRWSRWPLQDAVRRGGADLTAALRYYHAALMLDPNNVTAHRRLGQIMLSKGDMKAAQRHLVIAYAAAPDQPVTRQLLGEVYGVTGEIEEAAALWRTVANGNRQLETRQWWYNYLGAHTEEERIKEVIARVSQ